MPLYYKRFFPDGDIKPVCKKLRDKNKNYAIGGERPADRISATLIKS